MVRPAVGSDVGWGMVSGVGLHALQLPVLALEEGRQLGVKDGLLGPAALAVGGKDGGVPLARADQVVGQQQGAAAQAGRGAVVEPGRPAPRAGQRGQGQGLLAARRR